MPVSQLACNTEPILQSKSSLSDLAMFVYLTILAPIYSLQ